MQKARMINPRSVLTWDFSVGLARMLKPTLSKSDIPDSKSTLAKPKELPL